MFLTSTGDYRALRGLIYVHHVYIIKSFMSFPSLLSSIPAWKRKVSPLDPRRSSVARGKERPILPGRGADLEPSTIVARTKVF